jgi:hypothetical protein
MLIVNDLIEKTKFGVFVQALIRNNIRQVHPVECSFAALGIQQGESL